MSSGFKPLHTQDTDELLSKLEEGELPEIVDPGLQSVTVFVNHFKLVGGTSRVTVKNLFKLYKRFSPDPVLLHEFSKYAKTLLPFDNDQGIFRINKNTINLTHDQKKLVSTNKLNSARFQKQFSEFMRKNNLKAGGLYRPWYELYYFYCETNWPKNRKNHFGFKNFKDFCVVHFNVKMLEHQIPYYGINRESIQDYLTDDKQKEIYDWYKNGYKDKCTKKVQIPSFESKTEHSKSTKVD